MILAKVAALWPLIRIFSPHKRGLIFWLIQGLIWVNVLWYSAGFFALLFQCSPREKIWNPSVRGHCGVDGFKLFVAANSFNIVSDFSMLVLPLYSIWHLKLAIKQKLGVSVIFATGPLYVEIQTGVRSNADRFQRLSCKYSSIGDIHSNSHDSRRFIRTTSTGAMDVRFVSCIFSEILTRALVSLS